MKLPTDKLRQVIRLIHDESNTNRVIGITAGVSPNTVKNVRDLLRFNHKNWDDLKELDNETLEEKWVCPVGAGLVYTSPYIRKGAATIETSPVLAGKTVYVTASDGAVYGINKDDGKIIWKYATGAPIFGSVAVSGNALIAADFGGNVYTFCTR